MSYAFDQCQHAFDGLFKNLKLPGLTWLVRGPVAAWSRVNRFTAPPSDALGSRVARALQEPGELRDRITEGIFLPADRERALGRLEHTFELCYQAEQVVRKLKKAVRERQLPKAPPLGLVPQAIDAGIIERAEAELLEAAEAARDDAIQVDSFTLEEYLRSAVVEVQPRPAIPDEEELVPV